MTRIGPVNKNLYQRISSLLQEARSRALQNVNTVMVQAYWLIGREIVMAEQKGKARADYGKTLIEDLSRKLTKEFGEGWSPSQLWNLRYFFLLYKHRKVPILATPRTESKNSKILATLCTELSWSHYKVLMRVENENARAFYEVECAKNHWSVRELERQKGSLLYERLALSKDKKRADAVGAKGAGNPEIRGHH